MTAAEILASARTHLNDDQGYRWQDNILLPKLKEAQRELNLKMQLAGIPMFDELTVVMTVPANATDGQEVDLTTVTDYPTDIAEPIWLRERAVGQTDVDFSDMDEKNYIPKLVKTTKLRYWCWRKQKIYVAGATVDVEVQLQYKRKLTIVSKLSDEIEPFFAESYLSYRTAYLASKDDTLKAAADENMDLILRYNIKGMQNMPVRNRGYHTRQRIARARRW